MQPIQFANTPSPSASALPLWDKQSALIRLGQNHALLEKVVALFLAQAGEKITLLIAAVHDKDAEASRHFSHYLKGGAGDIGLSRLQHVCAFIEAQSKAGNMPAVEAILDEFVLTAEDTLTYLQSQQAEQ